ncbi:Alpha/Beta hydrolase protein, partial [Baffinella frigidus]
MRSSVVIPAAVALTAAGVLALWNALASKSARRRLRRDATLVQVGDRSVHVEDTPASGRGAGRDFTVVLDAGLGMSSLSWSWVRDSITRSGVRVVTFDRPGLGRSPAQSGVPWLRRVDVLVEQMHEVLEKVGANKKLVLVGHSSSGMHVRLFAHRYPKQVAGLVLVDAANEQQLGHLEGSSVYNSYPPAQVTEARADACWRVLAPTAHTQAQESCRVIVSMCRVTEAKLGRLKRLWHSGLLRIMYLCSGP